MSPRHTDARPGWILREFAKIRKQMREDRAARRLESATIGKGGLTITNGGKLISRYPNSVGGGEATRFGPDEFGAYSLRLIDETGSIPIFVAQRSYPTVDMPAGYTAITMTGSTTMDSGQGPVIFLSNTILLAGGNTQIEHSTTGASANCFIDPSDSRIWRSTSSRRYKQDIEDAEVDTAEVLALRPRTWRDKGEVERDPETTTRYVGLIAEEVDEHPSLAQFVTRKDGEPEAVDYDRLSTVALLAVVKDLAARVEALESADEGPAES